MDLLAIDDEPHTQELAEVCHKRTLGNIFFLISFIAMLEEEAFLEFDLNLYKYTWDIGRIKTEAAASSNVVDLVKKKMDKLPKDFGRLLSIAACLGASFNVKNLNLSGKNLTTTNQGGKSVLKRDFPWQ
jgi:histidine kinase